MTEMLKWKNSFELFLISFIGFFFAMLFDRWLGTEIRFFAYFKNVIAAAALMGLGAGVLASEKRRDLFEWFAPLTAMVVLIVSAAPDKLRLIAIPSGESFNFVSRHVDKIV
ncbi:MAG: hypothetical protein WCX65_05005, partial [bacterium]